MRLEVVKQRVLLRYGSLGAACLFGFALRLISNLDGSIFLAGFAVGTAAAWPAWIHWRKKARSTEPQWRMLKTNLGLPLLEGLPFVVLDGFMLGLLLIAVMFLLSLGLPMGYVFDGAVGFGLGYAAALAALLFRWEKRNLKKFEVAYYRTVRD